MALLQFQQIVVQGAKVTFREIGRTLTDGKPKNAGSYTVTATYTIQAEAAKETEIIFTATVPTATTNYNADSTGISATLKVSNKYGTQTALIVDKTSTTYGDSVTLTAAGSKATVSTVSGTVRFKVGGSTLVVEAPEIKCDSAILTTIREQAITPPNAGFAMLLATLCGGGVWFWKRKL